MSTKQFEILEDKPVFKGFFGVNQLTVRHTLYRGGWSPPLSREIFHRGECVAVLLYDAQEDALVMIEQFRVGALQFGDERAWLLEIVAGAIEPGETPESVARREVLEESGCEVEDLFKINSFFTSPGGTSELLHLYCGKIDSTKAGGLHGLDEENEDIAVSVMPFSNVFRLLEQGKIVSAIPIIAIQWLALNRTQLRQRWQAKST
ncbi:ADP-ribose pyrophosphatase [Methylophaga frappieri]|uniref:ADP-ribose pyrophosphatase n=1 Tax=Methylophaga frappieri (strain ATCC BAA-2434 / DSM 25690 / JAM7) TaxID=754477 RepID=I1YLG0_METFJ|nr:NUDIX domain-containing protein [Methylophaga frappieri]AFJ03753.1 ADP-ribose pyrophosphatase [Methylophaga frappieri]